MIPLEHQLKILKACREMLSIRIQEDMMRQDKGKRFNEDCILAGNLDVLIQNKEREINTQNKTNREVKDERRK